jgi:glyoxylase-like metal-dependent hydrolase (beta-lactamase superfamily II)
VFRDAPGHSDSQLTLHLPDRRLLFAADMLSDVEIPMLDRPPAVYRRTLEPLLQLTDSGAVETLVPGHGTIARGRDAALARLREDLAYLVELEQRSVAAARAGSDLERTTVELAAMEYRGKSGGPFAMDGVHRENVRIAWEAATRRPSR